MVLYVCLHLCPRGCPSAGLVVLVVAGYLPLWRSLHSLVLDLHWIPLWTLAGRRGGSFIGDRSTGGLQKGEVGRLILISQVARRSRGGRVNRGGVRHSGMSFHSVELSPGCGELSVGVSAGFLVLGGSLMMLLVQLLKQFCSLPNTKNE